MRIAPNNSLPATHFIEVWKGSDSEIHCPLSEEDCLEVELIDRSLNYTKSRINLHTYAIFYIRKNELKTKHDFNANSHTDIF